jgi:hypothetical protein
LGGYWGYQADGQLGDKAVKKAADDFAARLSPTLRDMRTNGLSLRQIAAQMVAIGIQTVTVGRGASRHP